MIAAMVKENLVENIIVIDPEQLEELAHSLGCELVDARPYGLAIGDLRTPRGWTRNAGGEQMLLPELEPEQYDSYTVASARADQAEQRADHAEETASAHAIEVVSGVVEDESRPALMAVRRSLDALVSKIADAPKDVNDNMAAIRPWAPGKYAIGDVRTYDGSPYRCVQAHDSTGNPDWTPDNVPALWMQYHGTSKESARPWIQPQGAHDQYLIGEWAVYNDVLYECVQNTVYSPDAYSNAWEKH